MHVFTIFKLGAYFPVADVDLDFLSRKSVCVYVCMRVWVCLVSVYVCASAG